MGVLRILATSLLILLGLITSATTINNANPGLLELRKTTPPSTRVMSLRLRGGNDDARMQDVLVSPTSRGRPPQNPPGSTQKGSERIYAVGGNSGVYLFTNTVESYAPADGARSRWRKEPPLLRGRAGCCAVGLGGRLFVMGGHDARYAAMNRNLDEKVGKNDTLSEADCIFPCLGDVDMLDPEIRQWQSGPPMQYPRTAFCAAAVSGRIFAVGGFDGRELVRATETFDPREQIWRLGPQIPEPVSSAACCAVGSQLFVIGGFDGYEATANVSILDTRTGTWSEGPKLLSPRVAAAAAVVGDRIYVLGGVNDDGHLSSIESLCVKDLKWRRELSDALSSPRTQLSAVGVGSQVYAVGGFNGKEGEVATVERYDPETGCSLLCPMALPRSQLGLALL